MLNVKNVRKLIAELEDVVKGTCGKHYDQKDFARKLTYFDDRLDKQISCGTACCLAGTVVSLRRGFQGFDWTFGDSNQLATQFKQKGERRPLSVHNVAERDLGLTDEYANTLFTGEPGVDWPMPFAHEFEEAVGEVAQAKVAIRLLKKVIATKGRILSADRRASVQDEEGY
jgi:hypothetical protein